VNQLERGLRDRWRGEARQLYFGLCDTCGRTEDDDGKALLVARQKRRRKRECFLCYAERVG
jgi:hypothetical protein